MKVNFQKAVDFAEKIKHLKGIQQILLFGSVARGEDTAASDIDIGIVFSGTDKTILNKEISRFKDEQIQVTLIEAKHLAKEPELTGAFSGDGILLYGQPISLKADKLGLSAKMLISYSLQGLSQTEKVKLNRALYGSVSESTSKGKSYRTETKGLTHELGIEKINKSVLLVQRNKAAKIIDTLKYFKATIRQIPLWTY